MKKPYIANYVIRSSSSSERIITETIEQSEPDEILLCQNDDYRKQTATIEQTEPDEYILFSDEWRKETRSIENSEPDEMIFW
ncbi:hypothetical protein AK95_03195 [Paenibacillus sp. LC231]|uniref:Uncharacterized protein n=1 Tax=Paenibacillus glucanolyticus TaxID=59843 RepID=A0A168EXI2_9BACL|nr:MULTISPECIES: hypothetical protein [Paenibacillus]KZS44916.1 hypothetical protein AWU65_02725 [Paenibacillus glucanolyticus]OIB01922.1 hypothetical protein AK95_03195 [Paenibacillus sp. LC231]OMF65506.1 hypothetical protein BK142_30630 [Paenibacillus glucanolyticus]